MQSRDLQKQQLGGGDQEHDDTRYRESLQLRNIVQRGE